MEDMPAETMTDMVNVLQTLGVDALDATRFVGNIIRDTSNARVDSPTFVEAYGVGNMVEAASRHRNLNVVGLAALGIRTKRPDGIPWDFSKLSHRKLALRMVRENKPTWIVGSPPCTALCSWNKLN